MKYRAEIDGLRALAVVPVILFHAGFETFSGGFVGVDVFFVISGYLITTIILDDLEKGSFSLIEFYERRARRILPALSLVMFISYIAFWVIMDPSSFEGFSRSLLATALFVSNIYFWLSGNYFSQASELMPFLHTWSLAVEEQFYLLFPVFLIVTWRFGRNRVFWSIALLALTSLALSEWGWRNNATANFYLSPTRAWELFSGSIAAFILQTRRVQASNALASIGLGAILYAIFAYDESTPFPSVYAVVPVLGVVLIVLFSDADTYVTKLLRAKIFVGVGLVSYSAYLWHQPVFAYVRFNNNNVVGDKQMVFAIIFTFLLAYLTWRFIENPIRINKRFFTRFRVFSATLITICLFASVGIWGHFSQGLNSLAGQTMNPALESVLANLDADVASVRGYDCHDRFYLSDKTKDFVCVYDFRKNLETAEDIIVWGDSHVHAFADMFIGAAQAINARLTMSSLGTCPPSLRLQQNSVEQPKKCEAFNAAMLKIALEQGNSTVIFSSRWSGYITEKHPLDGGKLDRFVSCEQFQSESGEDDARKCFELGYSQLVLQLENNGQKVITLAQIPEFPFRSQEEIYKISSISELPKVNYTKYKTQNSFMESLAEKGIVRNYQELWKGVCQNDNDCAAVQEEHLVFKDHNHASGYLARRLIPVIAEILHE